MKKLVFVSTALGLILAAPAYAQDEINVNDNNAALFGSAAFDDENTVANGNSASVSDSLNDNDLSQDNSINDSGNTDVSDSGNIDVADSGNTKDSFNTTLKLNAAVAWSDLDGSVANNTAAIADSAVGVSNTIDNGAFSQLAGINQNSQNAGANSLVQQNVNVQANMRLSSDGNGGM